LTAALYAFGHHDAIGFSRMRGGVEKRTTPENALIDMYDLISRLAPLILEHQGNGMISAVLLGLNDPPQRVQVGNYTVESAFVKARAMQGAPPPSLEPVYDYYVTNDVRNKRDNKGVGSATLWQS
jgi:hypothetical protein